MGERYDFVMGCEFVIEYFTSNTILRASIATH